MELQFQSAPLSFLCTLIRQNHTQELTQETRLSDGMPDIGMVLGAWGQVLLRSKQWNSDSVGVSAGVMAQILYEPEEGGAPEAVEVWLPFQQRFDLPDTVGREGTIHCSFHLAGIDARSTSARKLIVRANVDICVEAKGQEQAEIYRPENVPEDVQLLKNTYPVLLPSESGEKPFDIEEMLSIPAGNARPRKIITQHVYPRVQEKKMLTDKVIFRGDAAVHIVYLGEDDLVYSWDFNVPFSQYSELEQEYEPDAAVSIHILPTSMEADLEEDGQIKLQLGLVGQYDICQRHLLTLTEDAYSTQREVDLQKQQLDLPLILEQQEQRITAEQTIPAEGMRIADVAFFHGMLNNTFPEQSLSGTFQILYYDMEGHLRAGTARWEQPWTIPAGENTCVYTQLFAEPPQGNLSGSGANVQCVIAMHIRSTAKEGMEMVCAIDMGEPLGRDADRPSLILRRTGEDDLWSIAKSAGSTVEAILAANHLESEPDKDRILLIPLC